MLSEPEQFRQVLSGLDSKKMAQALQTEETLESQESGAVEDNSPDGKKYKIVHRAINYLLEAATTGSGYADAQTELGQAFEIAGDFDGAKTWWDFIFLLCYRVYLF